MDFNIFNKKAPKTRENTENTIKRLEKIAQKADKIKQNAAEYSNTGVYIGGAGFLMNFIAGDGIYDIIGGLLVAGGAATLVGSYGTVYAADAVKKYTEYKLSKTRGKLPQQEQTVAAGKPAEAKSVTGIKLQNVTVR